jgi:hypothetical protein
MMRWFYVAALLALTSLPVATQGTSSPVQKDTSRAASGSLPKAAVLFDTTALSVCPAPPTAGAVTERCQLRGEIESFRSHFDLWSRLYSLAYHALLIGAVLVAGMSARKAGAAASDGTELRVRLVTSAATLAFVSAVITGLNTSLELGEKWRANRAGRTEMDLLRIATTDPRLGLDAIRERLERAVRSQSSGVSNAAGQK